MNPNPKHESLHPRPGLWPGALRGRGGTCARVDAGPSCEVGCRPGRVHRRPKVTAHWAPVAQHGVRHLAGPGLGPTGD